MRRWVSGLGLLLGLLAAVNIAFAATATVVLAVDGMT
jgi:hypothetical protein